MRVLYFTLLLPHAAAPMSLISLVSKILFSNHLKILYISFYFFEVYSEILYCFRFAVFIEVPGASHLGRHLWQMKGWRQNQSYEEGQLFYFNFSFFIRIEELTNCLLLYFILLILFTIQVFIDQAKLIIYSLLISFNIF